jgi:hypothetical protein
LKIIGSDQDRDYGRAHAPRLYLESEEYLDLAFRVGFQPWDHNGLDTLRRLSRVWADIVPEEFAAATRSESSNIEVQEHERTEYEGP